jgi:hypothetical protein
MKLFLSHDFPLLGEKERFSKIKTKSGMVMHSCNPSLSRGDVEGS